MNTKDYQTLRNLTGGYDPIYVLTTLMKGLNPEGLAELEKDIFRLSCLLNDESMTELERVETALGKLSKIDSNEVVTPKEICNKMIDKLDQSKFINADKILEVNSKTAEFTVALYKKYGIEVAQKVYVIPSSNKAREFVKKIFRTIGLPESHVLDINSNKFIETEMSQKYDIVLMNPPYGKRADGNMNIQHKFTEKVLSMTDDAVIIMPFKIIYDTGESKENNYFKNIYNSRLISVEEQSTDIFNGTNMIPTAIYTFGKSNNNKIQISYFNGNTTQLNSLFEYSRFTNYEKDIAEYLRVKDEKPNNCIYHIKDDSNKLNKWLNNLLQYDKSIYLTSSVANGKMDGHWFSKTVGKIFSNINDLKNNIYERNHAAFQLMLFNTVDEAKNCRDAMNRSLLRLCLYRIQDDQNINGKCYKYIPNIDWSSDKAKTDEGILELCGCPTDKAIEYAEYCRKTMKEIDAK